MFAGLCLVAQEASPVSAAQRHAQDEGTALLQLASDFSPRYEMVRPYLVLVDIGGLGRLLGTPREIGEAFCHVARERGLVLSVAVAATHTTARLLALQGAADAFADPGDTGVLSVVPPGREVEALAPLPLTLLAMLPDDRLSNDDVAFLRRRLERDPDRDSDRDPDRERHRAHERGGGRAAPQGRTRGKRGRGWSQNYRLAPAPLAPDVTPGVTPEATPGVTPDATPGVTHEAALGTTLRATPEPGPAPGPGPGSGPGPGQGPGPGPSPGPGPEAESAPASRSPADEQREAILEVLRRWGLNTLGDFVRLPAADLFERLGREGLALQALARGQDARPLVPTPTDEPFETTMTLEWPIEALEPLSFVLTRLFEPLCARLERCDRAAAVLEVTLQLVTRQRHTRRLELPTPLRDPKVLRTLVLLDLESHPPSAGIDRVTLTIDPTPGPIVQHSLLARPLPTPEQLSTLLARLTAVMGEGRVGAPALVDTYRPEAFEMHRFDLPTSSGHGRSALLKPDAAVVVAGAGSETGRYALRRFRRAIPARVIVDGGRPVHVAPEGLPAGRIVQAAGPWRTSGEWWKSTPRLQPVTPPAASTPMPPPPRPSTPADRAADAWDRDEWDVALDNGRVYRLHLDHRQARWFLEACLD